MTSISVTFRYYTGIKRDLFDNAFLVGSWDDAGNFADAWSSRPMRKIIADDGCPCFEATVDFSSTGTDREFRWGVRLDGPAGPGYWAIATEGNSPTDQTQDRRFLLGNGPQQEEYYFTHCRRLGAQKRLLPNQKAPGLQFTAWAPAAQGLEVVFADFDLNDPNRQSGYIADGVLPIRSIKLHNQGTGIWSSDVLPDFARYDHKLYMHLVSRQGTGASYRTDLYSRCQVGKGRVNPADPKTGQFDGKFTSLDGTVSCSVVIDPDTVTKNLSAVFGKETFISEEEFWRDELTPSRPLPRRIEDLVIYELHVGSIIGPDLNKVGTFQDAQNLLDYLVDLGVNAIELLPVLEFGGPVEWGYGSSHYFALEFGAGGRDHLKHLIKACHQRGLAVILDVVYNHFSRKAGRAEWKYDSTWHENNCYYWYEGKPSDYPEFERMVQLPSDQQPKDGRNFEPRHGGYVNNMSTGYSPRFCEENVRKMFISSAVALVEEFHIDGFRVDQTTSMHQYNVLNADNRPMDNVNAFGGKFLREWVRTLRAIKPDVILIAEDHSTWDNITRPINEGGVGFDARWYVNFYHHLIGDRNRDSSWARLLWVAGYGGDEPLAMDYFAGALEASQYNKVVYHESHDEAGNTGTERTMITAVRDALNDQNRPWAEARCRFAAGMAMLSAGTPMFVMGEEIATEIPLIFEMVDAHGNLRPRPDLKGERKGRGRQMFRFYQDVIRLRLSNPALRARNLCVVHVHNANRVIAFLRQEGKDQFMIAGSLNNQPFSNGYWLANNNITNGVWREVFNSDSVLYGGTTIGNLGQTVQSQNGRVNVVIPANGFVVFKKIG